MPSKLQEKKAELSGKSANFKKIFDQSRLSNGDLDFLKADAFAHLSDPHHAREMVQQIEKELDALTDEVTTLEAMHAADLKAQKRYEDMQKVQEGHIHAASVPQGNGGYGIAQRQPQAMMTLGQLIRKYMPQDPELKSARIKLDREFTEWDLQSLLNPGWEQKVMITTGAPGANAGWAPYSTPIPRLAEMAARGIQVTDIFPSGTTDQFQVQFYEETTRDASLVVEKTENTEFGAAALGTTLRTTPIVKIPVVLQVTDEQMADVPGLASYVDNRLRQFVTERLDLELMVGDGIAPNMTGMINVTNVQTQAKGADTTIDAVYKAMDKVRLIGRATPEAVLMHPTAFQPIRLAKDTTGNYIWGAPSEVGPMRLWGVPIVITDTISAATAQVGAYVAHTQLWYRQGVEVLAGYIGDDFKFGRQAIRATLRAGLSVYRPTAFCNITGL
jgi:hypothetical protein